MSNQNFFEQYGELNRRVSTLERVSSPVIISSGFVVYFAGAGVPDGFLLCDGQAVSRTTYANLFAVIGTTFGVGDGSTTFNVPNNVTLHYVIKT